MGDLGAGITAAPTEARAAFGAARELLDRADADARRTRGEAEGFARQRAQEAELLLAKARRLLVAAEEKAAVIVAVARAQAAEVVLDLAAFDDAELGRVIAPGASRLHRSGHARLDRMLASAIAHAVDDTFPVDASV